MDNDRTPTGSRYHLSGCNLPDDHEGRCPIREPFDDIIVEIEADTSEFQAAVDRLKETGVFE